MTELPEPLRVHARPAADVEDRSSAIEITQQNLLRPREFQRPPAVRQPLLVRMVGVEPNDLLHWRYHSLGMPRHPRRAGTLVLLLAAPVFAQFAELATTDDGSQLYFTTAMSLKTADPSAPWEPRIYRLASGRVSLFAERGSARPTWVLGSGEGAGSPSVSGDGAIVGFTYRNVCASSPACSEVVSRIELRGRDRPSTWPGGPCRSAATADGRWSTSRLTQGSASLTSSTSPPESDETSVCPGFATWASSVRSPRTAPGHRPRSGRSCRRIVLDPTTAIWKPGQFRRSPCLPGSGPSGSPKTASTVFANGYRPDYRVVAQPNRRDVPRDAARYDHRRGKGCRVSRRFYPPATTDARVFMGRRLGIFAERSRVCLGRNDRRQHARAARARRTGRRWRPDRSTGDAAFIATTHGRIVQFDIRSKTVSPLLPQMPYCDDPGPVARGSLTPLHCSFSGSVAELEGKTQVLGDPCRCCTRFPEKSRSGAMVHRLRLHPPAVGRNRRRLAVPLAARSSELYDGAPKILPSKCRTLRNERGQGRLERTVDRPPFRGGVVPHLHDGLGAAHATETSGVPASLTKPNPHPVEARLRAARRTGNPSSFSSRARPGHARRLPNDLPNAGSLSSEACRLSGFECVLQSPTRWAWVQPRQPGLWDVRIVSCRTLADATTIVKRYAAASAALNFTDDQPRHAGLLHGHAVERLRRFHRPLGVRDHDELRLHATSPSAAASAARCSASSSGASTSSSMQNGLGW